MSKVILIIIFAVAAISAVGGYFLVIQQTPVSKLPEQVGPVPAPPGVQQPPPQPPRVPRPESPPAQDPRAGPLRQSIEEHFKKLVARDIRALMQDYIPDKAYAEWGGQAGSFAGRYDGTPNIRILWSQIIGNTVSISYQLLKYDASIEGDRATVRYTVALNGTGKLIGDFEMNIDAIQKFVYLEGKWLIDNDVWVFKVFRTSVVADATVFPLHWRKLGDFSVWNERAKDIFYPRWR